MIGNPEIIATLNARLGNELTAIVQYKSHEKLLEDWGFDYLVDHTSKSAIAEMKHAEKLIDRIVFLEGAPMIGEVPDVRIGQDVPSILVNDRDLERLAIQQYNESIELCYRLGDNATAEILKGNLEDEDGHINWLESQIGEIQQMTLPFYLQMITGEKE